MKALVLTALAMASQSSLAFLSPAPLRTLTALGYCDLPSIQDVSTDEFTEQVYHASLIVRALGSSETRKEKELIELLTAQLSHYDGMRGFFAAYATGQGKTAADYEKVSPVLLNVIKGTNFEILAPLACMNLIAPTAMVSVYTDPTLTYNSKTVAKRTAKILSSFKGSVNIVRNCQAIIAVAMGEGKKLDVDKKLVTFWSAVFDYNGYNSKQKLDIADAFAEIA